jgi:molybdenum cofactor cytidylyltransferase
MIQAPAVAAVILAAGAATRFGAPKQLATYRGEQLLARAIRHAREAGASRIIVVLGAYAETILPAIDGLDNVMIVINDDWHTGIASSLRTGIAEAMTRSIDGALFMTIDQPLVDASVLSHLIDAFRTGRTIAAAEYNGVTGVPALIGREHLTDLANAVTGDRGASGWLCAHDDSVTRVSLTVEGIDADTIEELHAIEQLRDGMIHRISAEPSSPAQPMRVL